MQIVHVECPCLCLRRVLFLVLALEIRGARLPVQARLAVKEVVLFDRATSALLVLAILHVMVECRRGWDDVWDLLWHRVLATDGGDTNV